MASVYSCSDPDARAAGLDAAAAAIARGELVLLPTDTVYGVAADAFTPAAVTRLLRPGGLLGIEHADQQGGSLPALVRAHGGFSGVEDHPDLAGRPRFTTARR